MYTNGASRPSPPARLYGLWVVAGDSRFWLNHIHGPGGESPMTFVSREDAERMAEWERWPGREIVVAVIGVCPPG